ncbi:hypothetical protein PCASD_16146 [Puccinia coronata f. sp. avenae]|uniref:Uncharacterized protein n=2 Tax=Puccinia coronata f. sp. avenae TaxID=200324 RepID=A0A2N5TAQ7_9BASI|nr:hypothetical protein PCASD_16146 [Puccinia coronata f. sp. avenae]
MEDFPSTLFHNNKHPAYTPPTSLIVFFIPLQVTNFPIHLNLRSELLLDSRGHKESPRNPARPHWWSGTWPHSNHSAAALAADATPTGQEAFTVNPGPPMLFEASSRQAWLHLLVLPAPYILLGLTTPDTSAAPDPLSCPRDPIALPTPLDFHHWRASQPAPHWQSLELMHATSPCKSPMPLKGVCQLKQQIAELKFTNGRMVSWLGQLERRSNTPIVLTLPQFQLVLRV